VNDAAQWSDRALSACLEHLGTSRVTSAHTVRVVESWTEGPDAICIVYRPPDDARRVVGLRRRWHDAVQPGEWRLGNLMAWGYDVGPDVDPVAFGHNVADFDLGEPLGMVVRALRYDGGEIGWWGSLGAELPQVPEDD
jgi:hypothetical protein